MDTIWNYNFLNNTVKDWAIALGLIAGIFLLLRVVQYFVVRRLSAFAERTSSGFDDLVVAIIKKSVMPLLYLLTIHYSIKYLTLTETFIRIEHAAIMVIATFFIVRIISSVIAFFFFRAAIKNQPDQQREKQSKGILLLVQIILWICGFLFLIDNLGYDITTIIAGLGIGGIAIALAAQTILGDLFSYLVIFFDKPFEIGDFIIIDDKMGTVEYVGIKTTRIRTLGGEQLICSNTDLTNSRVHNYKRMNERRIVFEVGIVYSTPSTKLRMVSNMLRKAVESADHTRFDRAHFKSFGDFSLNYEVVYYVLSADYNEYMDIQQEINLRIFEMFESEEIEFAFPTQTLYMAGNHQLVNGTH